MILVIKQFLDSLLVVVGWQQVPSLQAFLVPFSDFTNYKKSILPNSLTILDSSDSLSAASWRFLFVRLDFPLFTSSELLCFLGFFQPVSLSLLRFPVFPSSDILCFLVNFLFSALSLTFSASSLELWFSNFSLIFNPRIAIKATQMLEGCAFTKEMMEVLRAVAADLGDVLDENALHMEQMEGAMTNEVFEMYWPTKNGGPLRRVLIRLYGQGVEVFFNREDEIQTFEWLSKHGQGPRLLGRFSTGRVEEFIYAKTLKAADLHNPEISALIASKMREFHNLHMPGPKEVQLWQRMRKWLGHAKSLCSPKDTMKFDLDNLDKELNMLEELFSEGHQEIGFCHNDLQYGNMMMDNTETKSIILIDYEYASYNPIAYDLATLFCEMAADYHSDQPHLLDYSKYPGLEERQRFVHIYLSSEGREPSNAEVEQLVNLAEKYTLANHLFWGLWALISSYVNKIDFDYKEYAKQRFEQYWLRKPALLVSPSIISQDAIQNDSLASMT